MYACIRVCVGACTHASIRDYTRSRRGCIRLYAACCIYPQHMNTHAAIDSWRCVHQYLTYVKAGPFAPTANHTLSQACTHKHQHASKFSQRHQGKNDTLSGLLSPHAWCPFLLFICVGCFCATSSCYFLPSSSTPRLINSVLN